MSRGAFVCATLRYRKEFRSTKPNWPMDDSDTPGRYKPRRREGRDVKHLRYA